MRAPVHAAIAGITAFAGVAAIKQHYPNAHLPDPVFAGVVAALAAGVPDYLEPATSPHHRQFCHSAAFAALLAGALKKIYVWEPATPSEAFLRDALLSIGIGYLSHLGADFTTELGLPLIGNFG